VIVTPEASKLSSTKWEYLKHLECLCKSHASRHSEEIEPKKKQCSPATGNHKNLKKQMGFCFRLKLLLLLEFKLQ
jgi:hypothetical protein